ncbi:hypothetical protein ILYODFUR_027832 [Ilyodon furcidens]|uniref:Lactose synthase B protein n=1 Tax=Ilyodon furcidens TaxID=33524 RepID=A0ABV0UMN7_9TELE
MKVLVLFAFAVLGCSLAGARIVSKCELKQHLAVVFNSLPDNIKQSGLSGDRFLAKVVCHVEQLSGFNTSAVTQLGKQSSQESSESGSASDEGGKSKPPNHKQRSPQKQGGISKKDDKDMTLYGLFQLPEGLVCSDNITLPNLCGISCNKLTDDDISDDISCVVKLLTDIVKNGFMTENSKKVWNVVKQLIDDKCKNLNQYFGEC